MKVFDKIQRVVFFAGILMMGFVSLVIGITISIVYYKWWSILVIPLILILFLAMFTAAITLSKWFEYAVRNRTFKGFWKI
jgi:c-di-AMP phosphodiesterase-like protein